MNAIHRVTVTYQRSKLEEREGYALMGGEGDHPTPRVMGGWLPVLYRDGSPGAMKTRRVLIPFHSIVDVIDHGRVNAATAVEVFT